VSEANDISYDGETPFYAARGGGKDTCNADEWRAWGFDTTSRITAK
jgi:hypothetical protein